MNPAQRAVLLAEAGRSWHARVSLALPKKHTPFIAFWAGYAAASTPRKKNMRKRKYCSLQGHSSTQDLLQPGTPMPTVHNIVATSQILSSIPVLDLNQIHEMLPFSFYDQNKFAAITVRLHDPDCTTLLFSSGKLVVTGCRTWYECVYASLFIAQLLGECIPGHAFTLITCDVQNMVAHVEIPVGEGCLDLHGMYAQLALNCTYQRKMFPGLIYRPEASPVVLLCFFSGKVVITGGKNMEDVYSGWSRLWPTLKAFVAPEASERPPSLHVSAHRKQKAGRGARQAGEVSQPAT
jgi:transcription initiation factor TFIID TATA-box-binding protein